MALIRTSVQLAPEDIAALKKLYPTLAFSDIVRLALKFTLQNKPKLVVGEAYLAIENSVDLDALEITL